ncbi:hypothetical protein KVM62_01135 [Helicobacter pylori]|nr:hypothetical protein KVM62_01135 [Helicobacter pylori]
MRQKNETATSFNQLKEITQIMQMQKTHAKTSENAHASENAIQRALKPKATAHAKNHALNPTKKAFSERQSTAFRDNSQAIAKTSFETNASHNANAFKPERGLNSNLRAKPSAKALKQGLENTQSNKKGGSDE